MHTQFVLHDRKCDKRDHVFMEMAYCMAQLSKDRQTHMGAVIIGTGHELVSAGYNSFPRNINDDDETRQQRPRKYLFFIHAEVNAIANAARIGVSTQNCRLYANAMPCCNCAMGIINAGIKEVIIDQDFNERFLQIGGAEWCESLNASREMFHEAKIKLSQLTDFRTKLPRMLRGDLLRY